MNEVLQVLNKSVELLENNGWCRQSLAKDKNGWPVAVDSQEAVSFCSIGVIERSMFDLFGERNYGLSIKIECRLSDIIIPKCHVSIASWNDDLATSKRQVIATFKEAIQNEMNDELMVDCRNLEQNNV